LPAKSTTGPGTGSGGRLGGSGGTGGITSETLQVAIPGKVSNKLDLLFMVGNSSSTTLLQQKLAAQLPAFFQVLQGLPSGLPDLHVAVVSSDMGAPGDVTNQIGCTTSGDNGDFQYTPGAAAMCTSTTLAQNNTFISDGSGMKNFTDPIETVLQCIAQLGSAGCGFVQPLASINRALGTDRVDSLGTPQPPAPNANFLRTDALLGIVLLTSEDDCSAPTDTTIFSLNGRAQSITNPDGPIARYRCNGGPRGGHSCTDPGGNRIVPPLNPPSSVGNPPVLNLTDCQDNQTGSSALIPVSQFAADIQRIKVDPDNQILVAAIAAPAAPYGVEWVPPSSPPPGVSGELWPQVMHSCGALGGDGVNPMATQFPTDGTFGDPAVRISQFVKSFKNNVLASICDASYASTMTAIAQKLGALFVGPSCVVGSIQTDPQGNPACTVTEHLIDATGKAKDVPVQNCAENGATPPCWTLSASAACTNGGKLFTLMPDQAEQSAASFNSTLSCPLESAP
jgi:hypothetical protein